MSKAIIVAATPCCGKSTLATNCTKYKVLDVEVAMNKFNNHKYKSSLDCILSNMGTYDIILIVPSTPLLYNLSKRGIDYSLVYTDNTKECMNEWERRHAERGTSDLWKCTKPVFRSINNSLKHDKDAKFHYVLKPTEFLSDIIDKIYEDNSKQ